LKHLSKRQELFKKHQFKIKPSMLKKEASMKEYLKQFIFIQHQFKKRTVKGKNLKNQEKHTKASIIFFNPSFFSFLLSDSVDSELRVEDSGR
jgi:hypothetical protein